MPMIVYWIARQSPIDQRTLVTTYVVLGIGVELPVTALAEIDQAMVAGVLLPISG